MPSVFISHSSKDRDFVERTIIAPLQQSGIDAWYSKDRIETAAEWEQKIREGLKQCDWFLVAMSPNAVTSRWVKLELFWALQKREGRVVPAMIELCDPGELHLALLPLQYIDFSHDIPAAQKELVSIFDSDKRKKITELSASAEKAFKDRDWPNAITKLEALIRLDPARPDISQQLTHARQQHHLEINYREAKQAIEAKRWQEAVQSLRNVRAIDGSYENTTALLAEAADARVAELESKLQTMKTPAPPAPVRVSRRSPWIIAVVLFAIVSLIFLIGWISANDAARKAQNRAAYAEDRLSSVERDLENANKQPTQDKQPGAANATATDASITVQNKSTFNIYSLWMATKDATTWGADRLGSGNIAPGNSIDFKVPPGDYELKVKLSEASEPSEWTGGDKLMSIEANSRVIIEISNGDDSTPSHPTLVRSYHAP